MRRKFDFYETPLQMIYDLINYYELELFNKLFRSDINIFDPCAGDGNIIIPLEDYYKLNDSSYSGPNIITNDIQPDKARYSLDMTKQESWEHIVSKEGMLDLVITNPPFNQAFNILENATKYSTNVILLLRHSFLEPTQQRGQWLMYNPPTFIRIYGSPRPRFMEKGTDTVTTDWIGWINNKNNINRAKFRPISFAINWNTGENRQCTIN